MVEPLRKPLVWRPTNLFDNNKTIWIQVPKKVFNILFAPPSSEAQHMTHMHTFRHTLMVTASNASAWRWLAGGGAKPLLRGTDGWVADSSAKRESPTPTTFRHLVFWWCCQVLLICQVLSIGATWFWEDLIWGKWCEYSVLNNSVDLCRHLWSNPILVL